MSVQQFYEVYNFEIFQLLKRKKKFVSYQYYSTNYIFKTNI